MAGSAAVSGSQLEWPLVTSSRQNSVLRQRQSLYQAVLQVRCVLEVHRGTASTRDNLVVMLRVQPCEPCFIIVTCFFFMQLEKRGASIIERPLPAADAALSASCCLSIWTADMLQVRVHPLVPLQPAVCAQPVQ